MTQNSHLSRRPAACTCGAGNLASCLCGTTAHDWFAAENPAPAEHTLELVRGTDSFATHKGSQVTLSTYDVILDGTKVGRVYKEMLTREQRTPGRTYVNKRWQTPGWRYRGINSTSSRGLECPTRKDGIESILRLYCDLPWGVAEALAATVQKVR